MQRGAVPPLINMLKTNDRALREMAAFALGRLAQNTDNQAGIFAMGVLQPLLDLLSSKVKNLEHNAAFTLYGLADNSDNVSEIVKWVRRVAANSFYLNVLECYALYAHTYTSQALVDCSAFRVDLQQSRLLCAALPAAGPAIELRARSMAGKEASSTCNADV